MTAAAAPGQAETLLGLDHALVRPPTGGGRALHLFPEDVAEGVYAPANLFDQLRIAPAAGIGLPAVVIPGVQANFMAGCLGLAHQVPQVATDRFAGPGGAGQQNIPAVQAGSVGTQHLPEELRADEAPQVA